MTAPAPGFDAFLRDRGFDAQNTPSFLRRMFLTCWGEPGFHRFWRLWNPLYGYGLLRLYLALGGNRRPLLASFVVFSACGFFLHDLLWFATARRLTFASTLSFIAFWALSLASRAAAPKLRQDEWSRGANVVANVACIAIGLAFGQLATFLT